MIAEPVSHGWYSALATITEIMPVKKYEEVESKIKMASCCICFEEFLSQSDIRVTLCEHVFHNHCLVEWIKVRHRNRQHIDCPYCRETIHY